MFKTWILLSLVVTATAAAQKRVVCYYGSWATYRPGDGKFDVENIDPHICTHVVYTFVGLGADNKVKFLDAWNDLPDDYGKNAVGRMVSLKQQNPALKALLSIGGYNEGSTKYSQMAAKVKTRRQFIESVLEILQKYGFDGLDIMWLYPTLRGGAPEDKENFTLLLKELKSAMGKRFLLTAAVNSGCDKIEAAYDVPGISKYLDFMNLMAYDYHGGWEKFTGHHTQLYPSALDSADIRCYNTYDAVNLWLKKGAPAEKINLGLALYGRGWILSDASVNGLHAAANGSILAGPYTREAGTWGYNEICERQKAEKWTVVRDSVAGGPYAYYNDLWISYDDPESINQKAQFAMDRGLGGVMAWSLETDDFRGNCGGEKFPLLRAIGESVSSTKA